MIYVIRHGETDLNKEGRMQGRAGMPLNEAGIMQAHTLKEKLKSVQFHYVYSSPQERAVQTAFIATDNEPIIDARLDVFDLGEADRLKKEEVKMTGGIPDPSVYKGIEDMQVYITRVFAFMKETEALCGNDGNILISGHRCTTGAIGAYFHGIPEDKNILRWSSANGDYKAYEMNCLKEI